MIVICIHNLNWLLAKLYIYLNNYAETVGNLLVVFICCYDHLYSLQFNNNNNKVSTISPVIH